MIASYQAVTLCQLNHPSARCYLSIPGRRKTAVAHRFNAMKDWIRVLKAADAAARWHVHQRRKGAAKEPYINHLLEVATLVAEATDGEDPQELISETFGADVAGLVAEVTDDKTLEKAERKKRQVESAHKTSARAKMLKLADKTSNLRALVASPALDWSVSRRLEYIKWARGVAAGLRGTNALLENQFDEAARAAKRSLVPTL